jgi:hypothetical protein
MVELEVQLVTLGMLYLPVETVLPDKVVPPTREEVEGVVPEYRA